MKKIIHKLNHYFFDDPYQVTYGDVLALYIPLAIITLLTVVLFSYVAVSGDKVVLYR